LNDFDRLWRLITFGGTGTLTGVGIRIEKGQVILSNPADKFVEEIKKFQESAGNAKSWEEIVQEHKTTKEKLAVALEALEFIFENEYSSVAEAALMEIEKMGGTGD
jgi:hypothetical protein